MKLSPVNVCLVGVSLASLSKNILTRKRKDKKIERDEVLAAKYECLCRYMK